MANTVYTLFFVVVVFSLEYRGYSSNSFEARLRGVRGNFSSPYLLRMHGIHLQSMRFTKCFISMVGGFSAVALRAVTFSRIGCVIVNKEKRKVSTSRNILYNLRLVFLLIVFCVVVDFELKEQVVF